MAGKLRCVQEKRSQFSAFLSNVKYKSMGRLGNRKSDSMFDEVKFGINSMTKLGGSSPARISL